MLILTATTDKLQLVTENSQALAVHASVADHTLSTDNFEAKVQNTSISSATTTDIVGAPASGDTRNIKTLVVTNNGTSPNVVTVRYNANGTTYDLFKTCLIPNGELFYAERMGFNVSNPSRFFQRLVLVNDATLLGTTYGAVAGLNFTVKAGKTYWMRANIIMAVGSSGARLALNGPASPTYLRLAGISTYTTSATNAPKSTQTTSISAYDTSVCGSQLTSTTVQSLYTFRGVIVPSVNGEVAVRVTNDFGGSSTTVRAGSSLIVREPDNV